MAQNPVAIITSVEDVVVMPDASHIVITLDVGGPKVDLALEPVLALNLVDACAKGYAESRDIKKMPNDARTLLPASGFDIGQNDQRGVIGLTVNRRGIFTPDRRAIETPLIDGVERVGDRSCVA